MFEEQIGVVPAFNCPVSQAVSSRLSTPKIREVEPRHAKRVFNVSDNRLLDGGDVAPFVSSHQVPDSLVLVVVDLVFNVFRLFNTTYQM